VFGASCQNYEFKKMGREEQELGMDVKKVIIEPFLSQDQWYVENFQINSYRCSLKVLCHRVSGRQTKWATAKIKEIALVWKSV
jgi:hypothetical protein